MITMVRTLGRVLWMHWPALLAWIIFGMVAREWVIQLAGFVGTYSSLGMYALLPIAALARLIAFVAMFLVVRDALRELTAIAPSPVGKSERRRSFTDALLGGILPFFAVYSAWGFLREDVFAALGIAASRKFEIDLANGFASIVDAESTGETTVSGAGDLEFSPLVVAVVIAAFVARWLWKRHRERLPRWTSILATYCEALWIYLLITGVNVVLGVVTAWVDGRLGMHWLQGFGDWIAEHVAAIAWVWQGLGWLAGEAVGVIALPLAWLAIAGTLYGQAIVSERKRRRSGRFSRLSARYGRIPEPVRRRLNDVWRDVMARFSSIGHAIALMWRAGPVLIGAYVLLYAVWIAGERLLTIALPHLAGPQGPLFWSLMFDAIMLCVPLLLEPVRIALVAAAYDATLGVDRRSAVGSEQDDVAVDGVLNLDDERPARP